MSIHLIFLQLFFLLHPGALSWLWHGTKRVWSPRPPAMNVTVEYVVGLSWPGQAWWVGGGGDQSLQRTSLSLWSSFINTFHHGHCLRLLVAAAFQHVQTHYVLLSDIHLGNNAEVDPSSSPASLFSSASRCTFAFREGSSCQMWGSMCVPLSHCPTFRSWLSSIYSPSLPVLGHCSAAQPLLTGSLLQGCLSAVSFLSQRRLCSCVKSLLLYKTVI